MSTENEDIKKLTENVNALQKDMAQVGSLVDRLDVTIEKLTEVSTTVSQLLAVHGSRLEFQERIQEKLQDLVEKRRQEVDESIKDVYIRIEKIEKDLQKDMESSEDKIINKIDEIQKTNTNKIEEIQKLNTTQYEQINQSLTDRMARLERWVWTAVGGGIVIMWLLQNLDIFTALHK